MQSIDSRKDRGLRAAPGKTKLYAVPAPWAGSVAIPQDSDQRLLLDLAKEAFEKQVAKRVRPLSRGFVERWINGEFWLYSDVVRRHGTELRAFKPVVLEVLRATSIDAMLEICRRTRPDLAPLWHEPSARARLTKEIDEAVKAVQAL